MMTMSNKSGHLKNITQNWIISPGRGENKKKMKPPPRNPCGSVI